MADTKPKEPTGKTVATKDEAEQLPAEEPVVYADFEFPEEDAELGNAWFPVRPMHSAMATMITAPTKYGGTEYENGYAVRTTNDDGTIEDKVISDEEFSDSYVAVSPAKLD